MEKLFVCSGCGHIEFGVAPAACPVCANKTYTENPNAIMSAEKEGKEKHVPVLGFNAQCGLIPGDCKDVLVKVGSVPHPMQDDHWIMWVDVYLDKRWTERCIFAPQALQAAAVIHFKNSVTGTVTVIEHCNKHGSWMATINI